MWAGLNLVVPNAAIYLLPPSPHDGSGGASTHGDMPITRIDMPDEVTRTYLDGLLEGKVETIIKIQKVDEARLTSVESKVSTLEKASYSVLGAVALIQIYPAIQQFLS